MFFPFCLSRYDIGFDLKKTLDMRFEIYSVFSIFDFFDPHSSFFRHFPIVSISSFFHFQNLAFSQRHPQKMEKAITGNPDCSEMIVLSSWR